MADEAHVINEGDLDGFVDKITTWGDSLTAAEKGLLQVILARAGATDEAEVEGFAFSAQQSAGARAGSILRPMVNARALSLRSPGGAAANAWVQLGEPWIQSGGDLGFRSY